jgi:hypothetical protein
MQLEYRNFMYGAWVTANSGFDGLQLAVLKDSASRPVHFIDQWKTSTISRYLSISHAVAQSLSATVLAIHRAQRKIYFMGLVHIDYPGHASSHEACGHE